MKEQKPENANEVASAQSALNVGLGDGLDAKRYRWLRENFTRLIVHTDPAYSLAEDKPVTLVRAIDINTNLRDCESVTVDMAIDNAMLKSPNV